MCFRRKFLLLYLLLLADRWTVDFLKDYKILAGNGFCNVMHKAHVLKCFFFVFACDGFLSRFCMKSYTAHHLFSAVRMYLCIHELNIWTCMDSPLHCTIHDIAYKLFWQYFVKNCVIFHTKEYFDEILSIFHRQYCKTDKRFFVLKEKQIPISVSYIRIKVSNFGNGWKKSSLS